MPVNRNALIRYKTLDKCLQNRYRKWTLEDLIEACSDALYDYEGIDKGVSKRTVQADIQMMRSDKLGYNAPIIVQEKRYYAYEDPNYSITNIPLTDQDLGHLTEAVEFMKQFKGFSHFQELDGMVQKLEDHIYSQKTDSQPVIDFEKNDSLKGLQFLDVIYKAIINRKVIEVTYKSFKARQENTFDFHPSLLKEYRNRWFVIGIRKQGEGILNLALDRIVNIELSNTYYRESPEFDPERYFKNVIGVSVSTGLEPQEVLIHVSKFHAPYVLTKPLHHSQEMVSKDQTGITISLQLQHNFELEREILGFGDGMKVIAPERLKRNIMERIRDAADRYDSELSERGLKMVKNKLEHRGFGILNNIYTKKEMRKMKSLLDQALNEGGKKVFAKRTLLEAVPGLEKILFNDNLIQIVHHIDPDAFLSKSTYFDKPQQANWAVSWHQDQTIHVKKKAEVKGYKGWTSKDDIISVCPPEDVMQNTFAIRIHLDDTTEKNGALRVIAGTQNKRLKDSEIQLIAANSEAITCEVVAGGIHLLRPLILHASSKSKSQKRRRVIHLEFTSAKLPKELGWREKVSLSKGKKG